MIDHAKGLPDTESLPILRQAGALLESACGVADGTGDGRACTRLGRWTIFGVDGRPVDVRLAWDLLVKGWALSREPEAAYWLGWIAAHGHERGGGGGGGDATAGCGKPGGCGCAPSVTTCDELYVTVVQCGGGVGWGTRC